MDAEEERRLIDHVVQRMAAAHPDIPAESVDSAVSDAHTPFDSRRIRDFVPLFGERAAAAGSDAQARKFIAVLTDSIGEPSPTIAAERGVALCKKPRDMRGKSADPVNDPHHVVGGAGLTRTHDPTCVGRHFPFTGHL